MLDNSLSTRDNFLQLRLESYFKNCHRKGDFIVEMYSSIISLGHSLNKSVREEHLGRMPVVDNPKRETVRPKRLNVGGQNEQILKLLILLQEYLNEEAYVFLWQVVFDFCENHPDTGLSNLLREENLDGIRLIILRDLELSYYENPRAFFGQIPYFKKLLRRVQLEHFTESPIKKKVFRRGYNDKGNLPDDSSVALKDIERSFGKIIDEYVHSKAELQENISQLRSFFSDEIILKSFENYQTILDSTLQELERSFLDKSAAKVERENMSLMREFSLKGFEEERF